MTRHELRALTPFQPAPQLFTWHVNVSGIVVGLAGFCQGMV